MSPVYANFSTGFPPTLIQGGTKEILLSDFVRPYQSLDTAGQTVKLDLYEGMPHCFQFSIPDSQEGKAALQKVAAFLSLHLDMSLGRPDDSPTKHQWEGLCRSGCPVPKRRQRRELRRPRLLDVDGISSRHKRSSQTAWMEYIQVVSTPCCSMEREQITRRMQATLNSA